MPHGNDDLYEKQIADLESENKILTEQLEYALDAAAQNIIPSDCEKCGSRNFCVRYDAEAKVKRLWICSACKAHKELL